MDVGLEFGYLKRTGRRWFGSVVFGLSIVKAVGTKDVGGSRPVTQNNDKVNYE